MENKLLIDLAMKYGLDDAQVIKISNVLHQTNAGEDERKFMRLAEYICEEKLVDEPAEIVLEELKRKDLL